MPFWARMLIGLAVFGVWGWVAGRIRRH
jgi:hypothetical protein